MKTSNISTVSKRRKVIPRHEYRWNKRKRIGKSAVLEREKSRYNMPYELSVKKRKK